MYNYPRPGHHLVHAESHITQAVAAVDSCFGLSLFRSNICVELTIKLGVLCTRLVSEGPSYATRLCPFIDPTAMHADEP